MLKFLFHYRWDNEPNTPTYERWVTADSEENAIRAFYKERPDVYDVWYDIYREITHADGYKSLVLDM